MNINTKSENKHVFTFNIDEDIFIKSKEIAKSLGLSTTAYMQMAVAMQNNSVTAANNVAKQFLENYIKSENGKVSFNEDVSKGIDKIVVGEE